MKYSDFKKYILFIIISFVTVIGHVYAFDQRIDTDFKGSPVTISADRYIGLSCRSEGELKALSLDRKSNGDYTIQYNKLPDSDGTDKIYCEWTGENAVGFEDYASNVTFVFNYHVQTLEAMTISLNGSLDDGIPEADVVSRMKSAFGFRNVTITGVTWNEGPEFLNTSNCPSNGGCVVQASNRALNRHETVEANADFTYRSDGSSDERHINIMFLISYTGGLKLYPGGTGVCDFDGNWQLTSFGGYQYYESTVSGEIQLPNCTPLNITRPASSRADRTSDLLEFAGWVRVVAGPGEEHPRVPAIGSCSGAQTGPIDSTSGGNYSACYNYKDGVQLVIDSSSSLDPVGTCRETDTGIYFCEGTGTITLPNVVRSDTVVGRSKTFVGWYKDGETELKHPGDPVPASEFATYYAKYETTVTEIDRYKIVYVGQSNFLSVKGMTSCSVSSNPNLTATMQTNDCLIRGLQKTADREYIDVTVGITNEDGSEKVVIYKFQVKEGGNNTEASNGEFVIDVDARIEAGQNNEYALNDFDHLMCDTARIYPYGGYTDINRSKELNSRNYKAVCTSSPHKEYFALCMDPGRNGPNGDEYTLTERINQESDVGRMIGAIIKLINTETSMEAFDDENNSVRVAAHVAIRTVVLMNGYSGIVDLNDENYYAHYQHYEKLAKDLKEIYDKPEYKLTDNHVPKPGDENYDAFRDEIAAVVDGPEGFGIDDDAASTYLINLFVEYKNFEFEDGGAFQRTIDSRDTVVTGDNSYEITYKGTFTLPINTHLSEKTYFADPGKVHEFTGNAVSASIIDISQNSELSSDDQEVYDYEVKITVNDVEHLVVPKNHDEELAFSLKLTYTGGIDYSSIRIGNPLANSASKQRMLIFDLTSGEAYIYFDISAPSGSVCGEFESLDYTKCTDSDHCDINKSLFKASGCCREILDEDTYSYLINNVCNGECTVSTMSNVCSYSPEYSGSIDLYEVKEGAYYTDGSREYKDAIGTCIVNVRGNYAEDYRSAAGVDHYSSTGEATENQEDAATGELGDDGLYQKYDERGNSIMVDSYRDNEYCQVSCREDWKFTMGAFGNFVGRNAVLAGGYFQNHDNDIFIEGGRTCYTTYLDYDLFMNDLAKLSDELVDAYNVYANWSHAYSDIKKQQDELDPTTNESLVWNTSTRSDGESCLVENENQTAYDDDHDGEADRWEYNNTFSCASDSTNESYGYYTLDINGLYQYEGEDQGSYLSYDAILQTVIAGLATEAKLANPDGTNTAYSQDTHGSDSCTWTPTVTDHVRTWTATGDHCFAKDTHQSDEFTRLATEMMSESEGKTDTAFSNMSSKLGEINNRYEQFWNCQHFELYNGTDDANGKKNNPTSYQKFMGATKAFVQIMTMFEPYVSYTYDEPDYMTILQKDNILIEYDALNDNFFKDAHQPENYANSTNVQVDAEVGFKDRCNLSVTGEEEDCPTPEAELEVKLSRNKLSFSYYDPEDGPWVDQELVRTYGGDTAKLTVDDASLHDTDGDGEYDDEVSPIQERTTSKIITLCRIGTVSTGTETVRDAKDGFPRLINSSSREPDWHGGSCYQYSITYLNAHYVSASITNSSFYRNKGIWYTGPNDTREHGETLEEAWDNAELRGREPYTDRSQETKDKWSVFVGTKDEENVIRSNLNVFPIGITTARNLYQYTYEFTQIGSYTSGQLGRIMGDAKSVIPQNARTCFYEVVEDVCLCCGDPIVAYSNVNVPTAQEFIESSGYNYDFNREVDDETRGVVGFSTSTVATSDLNGSNDRILANNWTDKGVFRYGNNKLKTDKGAVALKEIEALGETVYLNDSTGNGPEYSFDLKPSTIAAIRDYNDMYGYTVNFDNLKLYGRASIQPLGACSDPNSCVWFTDGSDEEVEEMNNSIANFGHYGSVFLEDFDDIVGTSGAANVHNLSNTANDYRVCELVRHGDDQDATASDLRRLIDTGECRWIDYIETSNTVSTMWNPDPTIQYYRLAFK